MIKQILTDKINQLNECIKYDDELLSNGGEKMKETLGYKLNELHISGINLQIVILKNMLFKEVKRPWERKAKGSSDPYYQSGTWKALREQHRNGTTVINGVEVSNLLCVECYKKGRIVAGATADHIKARKDGGKDDLTNIQTLCDTCNAKKRAIEGQNRYKK